MIRLSDATLSDLPETIARPTYDRASLTPGIVHVGLGNFHRSHQAWYLHRLMQLGLDHDWAIIGAGVRPNDAERREELLRQDCLSTLIELDLSGTSAEVIGAMIDYVPVEAGNSALIRRMTDPNPAIVDTTRRVAFEGSARHTGFVLPIVRDGLRTGAPIEGLALVEALWARMCEGTREDGSVVEPNDPLWETLLAAANAARDRPRVWLEQRRFYGDLVEAPRFADAFARWLGRIWSDGCEATLQAYAAH